MEGGFDSSKLPVQLSSASIAQNFATKSKRFDNVTYWQEKHHFQSLKFCFVKAFKTKCGYRTHSKKVKGV